MRILGIIPARGGSKGVPDKNIKILGDKPLIAYTIQQALESKLLSKIIVSSDSDAIIEMAKNFGAEVPFVRPEHLATDAASSIAVVQHTVAFLEEQGEFFDAICLLQPTSPFREKGFIDKAIAAFTEKKADALISVLTVPHELNPHWVFELNESGFLGISTGEKEIIKRRQELPPAFFRDGSIYITNMETIKKESFYGDSLSYIESNPDLYINIDTMGDWFLAEQKLPNILSQI
ncbi:cytidylyltransferase domain-containing protein [Flavobacterium sp. GT3R68]|uniref:acylneuraminate cytidylyltransferase family protein n=1 Tax=Flavobacterium sp. GT3R68 TaxID=2594437 RepID=UPI000F8875FD|nr:acylneuraminate cytidylyltransferase family protein [Flavobacterium sp. GT3R68]RTY92260.1 acylneuraminate cytidylyltransferase family protein [Flavobacterium sp. GSN2]TRW92496.1 acylneuraminate cytidylyltransferase family protein [Flavobacterium sp. GT3R68]